MKSDAMMKKDRALYADVEEALRSSSAHVVYDSESAVLVRYNDAPRYLLGAEDDSEGERLLDGISEEEFWLIVRGMHLYEYAKSKGMWTSKPCFQVYYDGAPLDDGGPLEIRRPSEEDFDAVAATYTLTPREELREDFESENFFCGYLDGKLAAYAGVHDDGSLGMLHVFEEYRGRGLSKQMSRFMVNRRLAQGCLPYAQIFCDNGPSLGLQRRNGMIFSNNIIAWTHACPAEKR
ncbi:MAG: GNAT family N-acetyltransferase [Clostridia bacterium]|nr:GNAT family N-acetyltransferase [Clostridia bacterium]